MLAQLGENPLETNTLERAVDFGHTLSHPLEAATGDQLHHGFVVAIDVILASRLSLITEQEALRIVRLLVNAGLPIYHEKLDGYRLKFSPSIEQRAQIIEKLHTAPALPGSDRGDIVRIIRELARALTH